MIKKRALHYSLLLFGLTGIMQVQAQSSLYVMKEVGTQTNIALSGIRKLTFPAGSVLISKKDGTTQTFTFDELRYLSFNDFKTPTSIDETNESDGFVLYPSPAGSDLSVVYQASEVGTLTISILNVQGQTISQTIVQSSIGENTVKIDVSKIATGIYICSINNGKSIESKKLIINK